MKDIGWKEVTQNYLQALRLRYIYHTNAIEGNSLSLIETKVIISDGITVGGKKLSEHLEAINQSEALDFIEHCVKMTSQSQKVLFHYLKSNERL